MVSLIILTTFIIAFPIGYILGITTRKIFSDYHNQNELVVDKYLKFKRDEVEKEIEDYAKKSKDYLEALQQEKQNQINEAFNVQMKQIEELNQDPTQAFRKTFQRGE